MMKCRIFVPLCGKSKDLLYLKSQGFTVVGCEAVETACVDFFVENSIKYVKVEMEENMTSYETLDDGGGKVTLGLVF